MLMPEASSPSCSSPTSISWSGDDKLSLKTGATAPPANSPSRSAAAARLLHPGGGRRRPTLGEFCFEPKCDRRHANPDQERPHYRDCGDELLGAVPRPRVSDTRKQKIKAGVYTLRLGFQPRSTITSGFRYQSFYY